VPGRQEDRDRRAAGRTRRAPGACGRSARSRWLPGTKRMQPLAAVAALTASQQVAVAVAAVHGGQYACQCPWRPSAFYGGRHSGTEAVASAKPSGGSANHGRAPGGSLPERQTPLVLIPSDFQW